jgi:hypothetical protein
VFRALHKSGIAALPYLKRETKNSADVALRALKRALTTPYIHYLHESELYKQVIVFSHDLSFS